MYGDTTAIRALADRLRRQGLEIRAEADDLAGRAEAVAWSGLAADTMRLMSRQHAGDLRACAALHEDAAEALERHAREIEHLQALIAAVERRVGHLMASAAGGLGGLVHHLAGHTLPHRVGHWLAHFDPPPPGSKAWLDVHVPSA
jgi:hypothetical protein